MSEPFSDDLTKAPRRKSGMQINRSLTGNRQKENSMMLGINADDFQQRDNSELVGPASKKSKKQSDDAVFTSGTGSRPGSGGKGRRQPTKDAIRMDLKKQKTMAAQPRRSIFVGVSKKVNFDVDLSGEDKKDASSDHIDSDDDQDYTKKNATRYNLIGYNQTRKEKLRQFDFSIDEDGNQGPGSLKDQVEKANTLEEHRCTKNLVISLFWEEKIVLLIRILQIYSLFFVFYYEYFPSYSRKFFTPIMMGVLGTNWHIPDQESYYDFMQDYDLMYKVIIIWTIATILFYGFGLYMNGSQKTRYRLENAYSSKFNFFRWYFWLCEIMYLPFLINVAWPATCNFRTEREAIQLLDCKGPQYEYGMAYWWFMKFLLFMSYVWAVGYNLMLFKFIYQNKITTAYHEEAVQKKEVEFVLRINNLWSTEKFFTFSSFQGGLSSMYHRIIFNIFCGALVFINSSQFEDASHAVQIGFHGTFVIVFTLFIALSRPYRSLSTNILYAVAMIGVTQQLVFIGMKVAQYQQPIFIDKYFFLLTSVLNGLFVFIIMLTIMFMLIVQLKWPVDRKVVDDLTDGQVMAIYYIKEARAFQIGLLERKKYTQKDKEKMAETLELLSMEFNNFRGKQPLIMDSLLEIIDSLRLLQKNYENDPDLFNFDYQEDLKGRARERDRVFTLKQFNPQFDEEGNLLNDSSLNANIKNVIIGTHIAAKPADAAAPAVFANNSGFSSSVSYSGDKPEKTSYPEKDVGGHF